MKDVECDTILIEKLLGLLGSVSEICDGDVGDPVDKCLPCRTRISLPIQHFVINLRRDRMRNPKILSRRGVNGHRINIPGNGNFSADQ